MKRRLILFSALAFLTAAVGLQSMPSNAADWSWYRTVQVEKRPILDVPYVPTPYNVVNKMLHIAGVNSRDILYDLGCGDGRVVVTAAKEMKVKRAVGVDIDPQRIQESTENARLAGVSDRVTFLQKDLFDMNLQEASVVSLYLLPSINLKLRPKLLKELKPGSRVVSHDFDMGDWLPDQKVQMDEHTIYFWVVPAEVNGVWHWNMEDGNGVHQYQLRLAQRFQAMDGVELTVDDLPATIGQVMLKGDRLEFAVEGENPARFSGIVAGDRITGSITATGKVFARNQKWTAERDRSSAVPLNDTPESQLQI